MNTAIVEKTITVKTLAVDGRNMSKAFFRQIPEDSPITHNELDTNIEILGWVLEPKSKNTNTTYILYTQEDVLYRCATDWYEHTNAYTSEFAKALYQFSRVAQEYPQLYIGA